VLLYISTGRVLLAGGELLRLDLWALLGASGTEVVVVVDEEEEVSSIAADGL